MKVNIDSYTMDVIGEDAIDTKAKFGFIYVTRNKVNGKLYIGKKAFRLNNGIVNAWRVYLGSGKELKEEIKQYGKENFERYIIALADTKGELIELEKKYTEMFNAQESGRWLNIRKGQGLTPAENAKVWNMVRQRLQS